MDCFEYFNPRLLKSFDNGYTYHCPIDDCGGDVVEIDELIAPTIVMLNQKGYITKYCCSGHFYKENPVLNTYIYFEDYVELPMELPYGFELERDHTIRKWYRLESSECQTPYDFVVKTNRDLYQWTKTLPDLYEEE